MRKEDDLKDVDILRVIPHFKEWRASRPTDSDGLDRMLDFIEGNLHRNTNVVSALVARFSATIATLRDYATQLNQDAILALDQPMTLINEDLPSTIAERLIS